MLATRQFLRSCSSKLRRDPTTSNKSRRSSSLTISFARPSNALLRHHQHCTIMVTGVQASYFMSSSSSSPFSKKRPSRIAAATPRIIRQRTSSSSRPLATAKGRSLTFAFGGSPQRLGASTESLDPEVLSSSAALCAEDSSILFLDHGIRSSRQCRAEQSPLKRSLFSSSSSSIIGKNKKVVPLLGASGGRARTLVVGDERKGGRRQHVQKRRTTTTCPWRC